MEENQTFCHNIRHEYEVSYAEEVKLPRDKRKWKQLKILSKYNFEFYIHIAYRSSTAISSACPLSLLVISHKHNNCYDNPSLFKPFATSISIPNYMNSTQQQQQQQAKLLAGVSKSHTSIKPGMITASPWSITCSFLTLPRQSSPLTTEMMYSPFTSTAQFHI